MLRPLLAPRRETAAQQARTDLFLLLAQAVLSLMAGAWAAKAAAPQLPSAAWIGSCLMLVALVCAYGSVRVLVATVFAPWAVLQLMQRARDPRLRRASTSASERRFGLAMNAIAMTTFIVVALAAAAGLWWWAEGVDLIGALWRFGVAAAVLAAPIPRAIRALG